MAETSSRRTWYWPVALIAVIVISVAVLVWSGAIAKLIPFAGASESKDTQIITAVEQQEELALVSLGVQGIKEKNSEFTINDWQLPGTAKATFIQYTFKAKLGIDGEDVSIEQDASGTYQVSIPEFIFIGHDEIDFKLITENNGALSWLSPAVEQTEMINEVLGEDLQAQYLADHEDALKDQSEHFYRSIITGIQPEADVEFEFQS